MALALWKPDLLPISTTLDSACPRNRVESAHPPTLLPPEADTSLGVPLGADTSQGVRLDAEVLEK